MFRDQNSPFSIFNLIAAAIVLSLSVRCEALVVPDSNTRTFFVESISPDLEDGTFSIIEETQCNEWDVQFLAPECVDCSFNWQVFTVAGLALYSQEGETVVFQMYEGWTVSLNISGPCLEEDVEQLFYPEFESICGCTEEDACNYNEIAEINNGSCYFYCDGCLDPEACNYNPEAFEDDGSCLYGVLGCTDPSACNYSDYFTCDDGSCCYNMQTLEGITSIMDDQENCAEIIFEDTSNTISVIEEEDDFAFVHLTMEHSFLGDLTITLYCPEGNSVVLHNQGGGGTYLGEPYDNDAEPAVLGVGYDYFWTSDATYGTMIEEAGTQTLDSETYTPVEPFSNLIGCSVDGEWMIEICDAFSGDNGFVFAHDIGFDFDEPHVVCYDCEWGCTFENACNYLEEALYDDGSCIYLDQPIISGEEDVVIGEVTTYSVEELEFGEIAWSINPANAGVITNNGSTIDVEWLEPGQAIVSAVFSYQSCTSTQGNFAVNSVVSVDEQQQSRIYFYPNPTSGQIGMSGAVNLRANAQVEVYSVEGKLVKSMNPAHDLSIQELPSGVYFLRLVSDDQIAVEQIIVKR